MKCRAERAYNQEYLSSEDLGVSTDAARLRFEGSHGSDTTPDECAIAQRTNTECKYVYVNMTRERNRSSICMLPGLLFVFVSF